jgi:hypothetical protein
VILRVRVGWRSGRDGPGSKPDRPGGAPRWQGDGREGGSRTDFSLFRFRVSTIQGSLFLVDFPRAFRDDGEMFLGKAIQAGWSSATLNQRSKGCSLYEGRFTWLKMREGCVSTIRGSFLLVDYSPCMRV